MMGGMKKREVAKGVKLETQSLFVLFYFLSKRVEKGQREREMQDKKTPLKVLVNNFDG